MEPTRRRTSPNSTSSSDVNFSRLQSTEKPEIVEDAEKQCESFPSPVPVSHHPSTEYTFQIKTGSTEKKKGAKISMFKVKFDGKNTATDLYKRAIEGSYKKKMKDFLKKADKKCEVMPQMN